MATPIPRVSVGVMAAAVLLSLLGAEPRGAGTTGTISGRVLVTTRSSKRLPTPGAYPGRTIGKRAQQPRSEAVNVVVFVKTSDVVPSPPTRATIRQTDEVFVPHVVAITAGSTVEFPNDDLIFHNVFSLSRAATFDLGRYPQHASKSRVFPEPGIVKVFCHLHSHMSAVVRVFSHPYFAIPDEDGRFVIADVAPGAYQVAAWHERVGETTQAAVVTAGGTTELSFSLPLRDAD